ncbi:MAG TPA: hypothetical protein ENI87_07370 [bacterium]|nr:hypothetical protein [bacterium]
MKSESLAAAVLSTLTVLPLVGQEGSAPRRLEVDGQIVEHLLKFARKARANRQFSRAREVWQMVLDHYDSDCAAARKGLGFRKVKGEWLRGKASSRADYDDRRMRLKTEKAWRDVVGLVGELHGNYGLELVASGDVAAGHYQLERALVFQPDEARWHRGLGHEEIDGFFGSGAQIAFVRRMREIRDKADELREQSFPITELDASRLPPTLRRTGIAFKGARSKHFTHWIAGAQSEANDSVQWAERCYELLSFLLGRERRAVRADAIRWNAFLQDNVQRDILFASSPESTGRRTADQARMFAGTTFKVDGYWASVTWGRHDSREDRIVAHVARKHLLWGRNTGLSEGLMHVCQYLICGTTLTYYASLPHTVSSDYQFMRREPGVWQARIEEEIAQGKDWPLDRLARERSDNFRDSARVKAWSFMGWLVARYPDRWWRLITVMGPTKELTPETAAQRYREALGVDMHALQAEWREWARAGSPWRETSGF